VDLCWRRFSWLGAVFPLRGFFKPHACASAILINELDTGSMQCFRYSVARFASSPKTSVTGFNLFIVGRDIPAAVAKSS